MVDFSIFITITVFCLTVLFLMWRPGGINEAIPPTIGAAIILMTGIVPLFDLLDILKIVSGASVTIISTIVMSIVLESIGLFRWAAYNMVKLSNGSGIKLFWYINLICFLMTLFFNNDGSILITTPIIIQIFGMLNLKPQQKIPYLLSGALVATASSAPIGVSNLANLIALKIVGLDLNTYALLMFVPSMLGILLITVLLFLYFRRQIPRTIKLYMHPDTLTIPSNDRLHFHPLMNAPADTLSIDWKLFRLCISIVILIRAGFFLGTSVGIPIEVVAIAGAVLLIGIRWYKIGTGPVDILKKTPWHILVFAASIYVLVFALDRVGLTDTIINYLKPYVMSSDFNAVMIVGTALTVLSNIMNNLPAVMIGTLSITEMGLHPETLQLAYLANIIGSDIGSLLTPMGTLASLIWMFMLRKNNIPITWGQYMKVTFVVIPAVLYFTLFCLFLWSRLIS